jgi:hypothetical protein
MQGTMLKFYLDVMKGPFGRLIGINTGYYERTAVIYKY